MDGRALLPVLIIVITLIILQIIDLKEDVKNLENDINEKGTKDNEKI